MILGEIGSALVEYSGTLTQFINYAQSMAEKENKRSVKLKRPDWVGLGHQGWKKVSPIFNKLPGNLEWGRKGILISFVIDRSPTWKHDWQFNFVHFRPEYKMKVPLGQVMVLKILNTIYWTMSKINSLKKSLLDTWKIWIQIWWITLIAPHFLQRLRKIITEHVEHLEKKQRKKDKK